MDVSSMLALPIFPGRLQPSIFGRSELNFRVRNGNGWTLILINTNYFNRLSQRSKPIFYFPCPNFKPAKRLKFGTKKQRRERAFALARKRAIRSMFLSGDPYGNRTHVCGVRGRRLNRLTNGPYGAPSGIRTRDPLIKSQLLYQLS